MCFVIRSFLKCEIKRWVDPAITSHEKGVGCDDGWPQIHADLNPTCSWNTSNARIDKWTIMDDDISAAEGGKKVRKVMSSAICQFDPSPLLHPSYNGLTDE